MMRRPALIRQSALITREERFWRAPSQGGSRPGHRASLCAARTILEMKALFPNV